MRRRGASLSFQHLLQFFGDDFICRTSFDNSDLFRFIAFHTDMSFLIESSTSNGARINGRGDIVQRAYRVVGQMQIGRSKVFVEMRDGRRTGNDQHIRRAMKQPSDGYLHRRCIEVLCDIR
jgi:hypothetical protein